MSSARRSRAIRYWLPALLSLWSYISAAGQLPGTCISPDEAQLEQSVNDFRAAQGLPRLLPSRSLYTVAAWHAWDLQNNAALIEQSCGSLTYRGWSGARPDLWSECCTGCSGSKPAEITGGMYVAGTGELAAWSYGTMTASLAIGLWADSPGHRDMLLEQGSFASVTWNVIGVGMSENYAFVWLGVAPDLLGVIDECTTPISSMSWSSLKAVYESAIIESVVDP